ncbi:MAG: LamG-like jellyroll fold domain-containing protein [Tenuifilum sp.]|uniref:LamG-like jellyroll fold domain-containing protein n=1 Tax=Tenuifilum sp. TaxID=2760880 RepID=UPI003CC4010C
MKNKFRIFGALLFGAVVMGGLLFTACSKDDDNNDNGKVDPSTIATANLVAYMPFDDNALDKVGNLTPSQQPNVTYVVGRRGKAYQGADGAYLRYNLPDNSKLKTLKSYTVAMWIKSPKVDGTPVPKVFEIGKSDDLFWGNLTIMIERLTDPGADSLFFKLHFKKVGVPWEGQWIEVKKSIFQVNKWMHLVFQYDATTSKFMVYKDGVKVEFPEAVENRYANDQQEPLGDLNFVNADVLNIGAWRPKTDSQATDEWMGWFMGNLDELRVYDKALSATEVKALYDAEVSQITE